MKNFIQLVKDNFKDGEVKIEPNDIDGVIINTIFVISFPGLLFKFVKIDNTFNVYLC